MVYVLCAYVMYVLRSVYVCCVWYVYDVCIVCCVCGIVCAVYVVCGVCMVCVCGMLMLCVMCVCYVCVCVFLRKSLTRRVSVILQVIWHAISLGIFCGSLESKQPLRSEINKVADSSGLKCCHHLAGVCCHTLISDGEV